MWYVQYPELHLTVFGINRYLLTGNKVDLGFVVCPIPELHLTVLSINRYLPTGNKVDLGFVVCPRPKLHLTVLGIEREVSDVDFAGAPQSGGRRPEYVTRVLHHGVDGHETRRVVIGTEIIVFCHTVPVHIK